MPKRTAVLALGGLVTLCSALAQEVPDAKADLTQLLDGVTRIGAPGAPGIVSVFGPHAFAVVAGGKKDERVAVVAAARSGRGRLVAFGHNGYFNADQLKAADTGRLLVSCAQWAAGEKKNPRVATWQQDAIRQYLQSQGLNAKALSKPEAAAAEADVVILGMNGLKPDQEKALAAFVAQGGGVITSDCPWGWLQLSGGKSLRTRRRVSPVPSAG